MRHELKMTRDDSNRLTRIETRLTRLMLGLGVDPFKEAATDDSDKLHLIEHNEVLGVTVPHIYVPLYQVLEFARMKELRGPIPVLVGASHLGTWYWA